MRFRSPAALLRAYWVGIARKSGWRASEVEVPDEMEQALRRHRMWAFVTTDTKVPVVRYWHEPGVSRERLAMMLGHELGHVTGKQARGHAAEEDRADEYGRVAAAVYRRIASKRRTRP